MPIVEVVQTEGQEAWTITVQGEVDASSAAELRESFRRAMSATCTVVDLRAVPFMDSAGLGALIGGIRQVRCRGGSVALCVRKGAVQRLLAVTGFDRIIPTAPSLQEAHAICASTTVPV